MPLRPVPAGTGLRTKRACLRLTGIFSAQNLSIRLHLLAFVVNLSVLLSIRGCWAVFWYRCSLLRATLLCALMGLVLSRAGMALEAGLFEVPLDDLEWIFSEVDSLECSLTKPVPGIGPVTLSAKAGARSHIVIPSHLLPLPHGSVYVGLAPASWNRTDQLSSVAARPHSTENGLVLELEMLPSVWLAQLSRPLRLMLHFHGELGSDLVAVEVPTVGASLHRVRMTDCIKRLLPYDFEQLNGSVFYFQAGKDQLDDYQIAKLKCMASYLKKDDSVKSVVVDGHSDSSGDRLRNLQLSKKRAEAVVAHLEAAGIPAERELRVRHHGQRYPTAANGTRAGRALNRRVVVRLGRDAGRAS